MPTPDLTGSPVSPARSRAGAAGAFVCPTSPTIERLANAFFQSVNGRRAARAYRRSRPRRPRRGRRRRRPRPPWPRPRFRFSRRSGAVDPPAERRFRRRFRRAPSAALRRARLRPSPSSSRARSPPAASQTAMAAPRVDPIAVGRAIDAGSGRRRAPMLAAVRFAAPLRSAPYSRRASAALRAGLSPAIPPSLPESAAPPRPGAKRAAGGRARADPSRRRRDARRATALAPRRSRRHRAQLRRRRRRRATFRRRHDPQRLPDPAGEGARPAADLARQRRDDAEAAGGDRPARRLLRARELQRPSRRPHARRPRDRRLRGGARQGAHVSSTRRRPRRSCSCAARPRGSTSSPRPGAGATCASGDEIVVTWLEHHANIVPWQQLCLETGAQAQGRAGRRPRRRHARRVREAARAAHANRRADARSPTRSAR